MSQDCLLSTKLQAQGVLQYGILNFMMYELFINLKSSYKHLLGIRFCTGTRNVSVLLPAFRVLTI